MIANTCIHYPKRHQSGLTLVEIMVALAISLIVLAGVIQIFISNKQSYSVIEANSRVQEDGRFSMELLTRDIRMADFWGCGGGTDLNFANNLDSAGSGFIPFTDALRGTDGTYDTIIIRKSDNSSDVSVTQHNQMAATLFVNDVSQLDCGDIVMVCNVNGGDIFQITNQVNSTGAGTVVHNTGNAHCAGGQQQTPGNLSPVDQCPNRGRGSTHCLSRSYDPGPDTPPSYVYAVQSLTYSVADTGRVDKYGDPILALYRQNGSSAAQEIIENIENFQLRYGIDNNEDYSVDQYVTASTLNVGATVDEIAENWDRVIAVQIAIVVRSADAVRATADTNTYQLLDVTHDPADDMRLRRAFTKTVAIRNRLK